VVSMSKSKTGNKLEALIRAANAKYGEGTIMTADKYPQLPRVRTGILSLDLDIGGGIPKGRIVIFTGNESTGKSTVAQIAVARFQNTCRTCGGPIAEDRTCLVCKEKGGPHQAFIADLEGTFDGAWFEALGGNLDELYLCQPEFAEQAADVTEAVIRTGEVDIVVIDSLANMAPFKEIEDSAESQHVGIGAKLNNRFLRCVQAGLNSLGMSNLRKPAVIIINQVRERPGVMFGNPEVMPGGRGQRFSASIIVKFFARPSERIYETGGEKRAVGQQIRYSVEKNKTFPPHREGYFILYHDDTEEYGARKGEVDVHTQLIQYGCRYGLIKKAGSWYSYKNVREQGEANFHNALVEQMPEAFEELREALFELLLDVPRANRDVEADE